MKVFVVFGKTEKHKLTMTNDNDDDKIYNQSMTRLSTLFRWSLVSLIVIISGALMFSSSQQESAIMDELAHIPAGYSYVKIFDSRLNPEHPPLVKILAGLPLAFQNLKFPTESYAWNNEVNSQWTLGTQFLYESGNDADKIIQTARIGPTILTLILIVLIYLWSMELSGRWWALLPSFLFGLSPTVLAHGHYVTTDVGAALGIFIALWTFVTYLHRPNRHNLILAGIAFGVAQLMKFSAFLLAPYLVLLALIFYVTVAWRTREWDRWFDYVRAIFLIFVIGFALIYVFYLVTTLNYPVDKQIADTRATLSSFQPQWLASVPTTLAGNPITRPIAEYLLGLFMVSQRVTGGNTVYFLGEVASSAWWHYFPVIFILKEPLPSLFIIIFALATGLWGLAKGVAATIARRGNKILEYLEVSFPEFAMLGFIIFYWLYSMAGNLNIGVRHIIPTLPFIYILSAGAVKKWFGQVETESSKNLILRVFVLAHEFVKVSLKSLLLGLIVIWYVIEVIMAYPHYLSYYNLAAGGTANGYKYAVDSNYDWGQDLKRLRSWVGENLALNEKIAVDYFGGGNPKYYLGDRFETWSSAKGTPATDGIKWLAVSIEFIQSAQGMPARGFQRKPEDEYQWLVKPYEPYARAGNSIFIYELIY